ncbi:hypothetical protein AcV7_010018 [Taiwanofungus camphoratus]|nr:hypothetical protein AcV7_010018 [Antrodia cinnamomea]
MVLPPAIMKHRFNYPNADVIIRSSDCVDFHVHKLVLSLASPFFHDMFTLPQPAVRQGETQDPHPTSGLPLVRVTENSGTLDCLLRLCYPVADPAFLSAMQIKPVLEAAIKYQMEEAIVLMKNSISARCVREPLVVYAVACQLNLEGVAEMAAESFCATKLLPIDAYVPEMDDITAGAYYRLLQYRKGRSLVSSSTIFTFCKPDQKMVSSETNMQEGFSNPFPRRSDSDIIARSSNGVDFYLNRHILSYASSEVVQLFPADRQSTAIDERTEILPLPIFSLAEDSRTLVHLFQLCYPIADPEIEELDILVALLDAGTKYKVPRAVELAKGRLMERLKAQPLRLYLIAMRHNWVKEAPNLVRRAVSVRCDTYVPEMESVSASAYRRLLLYRRCSRDAVSSILTRLNSEGSLFVISPPDVKDLYFSEKVEDLKKAHPDLLDFYMQDALAYVSNHVCPHLALASSLRPQYVHNSTLNLKPFIKETNTLGNSIQKALAEITF